jgi:hypothetical protein
MRLVPALALEPPHTYVAFVATHLEPLRAQAASVVGGEADADQLYPEVLTDVAVRWRWLLWRSWLGRPEAPDSYLRRAFLRRSRRWHEDQAEPDEYGGSPVDIEVWTADRWTTYRPPRPVRSSGATRLAAFVRPAPTDTGAIAEAAIAWWHAYEARRRRRFIAYGVLVCLFMALMVRLTQVTV